MEIKLNIYDGNKIVKTYTANEVNLSFGVIEDILELIDVDKLTATTDDVALMKEVIKVIARAFGQVKTILREMFPDITEDELKHARMKDIALILIDTFKFAFAEIAGLATGKAKN